MSFLTEIVRVITRKPTAQLDIPMLDKIEDLLVAGEFQGAIDEIDNHVSKLNEDDHFADNYFQIFKARLISEQSKVDEAESHLNDAVDYSEHPVISSYTMVENMNILRLRNDFGAALEQSEETELLIGKTGFLYPIFHKKIKARYQNIQAKIFNKTGKFTESITLLNDTISMYTELGDTELTAEPLNDLGIAYANIGDATMGLNSMMASLKIYDDLGNERQALKLNNNIGLFNYQIGKLTEASQYLSQALVLSEKFGLKENSGAILLNLGLIFQDRGDITLAIENLEKSLDIFTETGNKPYIAVCQTNLANIYQLMGDVDKAIKTFKGPVQIWEELGNKGELIPIYTSMATAYSAKGLKPKAISLFNDALAMSIELGNHDKMIHPYSSLIEELVDADKVDDAKQKLKEFEEILPNVNSKVGEQLYKLSNSQILLKSARVVNRAEAQKILTELAEDEEIPVQYAIKAYLRLSGLLLDELDMSASEEALDEFKALIGKLTNLTETRGTSGLTPTTVEVLLLRSKLALIDLEIEEAKSLQEQALEIASQARLKEIVKRVKAEQEAMDNQMMKYKQMVDTNASLYERLQESQISNYLKKAESILKR
ncbi:MAG: tetratricopeptide repeat protein [Candidatus Kariarchaeaceae archaeon]